MTTKIVITSDSSTPVSVLEGDTEFIVDEGVTLSTAATAIVATGAAIGRYFYINGTVVSASSDVFQFGTTNVADSQSQFVISSTGKVAGSDYGLKVDSGGLDLSNAGTIEARLTAITAAGEATQIVNSGLIASSAGMGIAVSGSAAVIINHGKTHAETTAAELSGANALFTNNGELRSDTFYALFSSGEGAVLTNHGTVIANGTAILSSGIAAIITNDGGTSSTAGYAIAAKGGDATITNSGTISAGKAAILLTGNSGTVTNDGLIETSAYAIAISADDATITNNKTITAGGGVKLAGANGTLTNHGTVTGTSLSAAAVDFSGASKSSINNTGLISAKSLAFLGGDGIQSVFNSGTITGAVKLGGGNDYFDGNGGQVNGFVYGGTGNDVYVISDAAIKLSEASRGGADLVKASVSFTLGSYFENLTLNGTASINATGNTLTNRLHGNSGKNSIDGLAGSDLIWGHAGADRLTGGSGADQFVFNTGDGKDRITDFAATGSIHDTLDLAGLASITSYADLTKNHMRQVGSDVLINGLNGDSILLKNLKLAALDKGDFLF
jgi:Ca2+-binding RTX toxin-like protein